MTETAIERTDVDISHWAPWCRFFETSDGQYFVIDADLIEYPGFVTTVIRRDTALFFCGENAAVTDLVPDRMFPPGTTAEQAVEAMGYILEIPEEGS